MRRSDHVLGADVDQVDVLAHEGHFGAVHDARSPCPDHRAHAHRAGLTGAVHGQVGPALVAVMRDVIVHGDDFRVVHGVGPHVHHALADHFATALIDDDRAEGP